MNTLIFLTFFLQSVLAQDYFITKYVNYEDLDTLPNPRDISNILGHQTKKGNPDGINALFIYFGQFIDHDISLTPTDKTKSCPIVLKQSDPLYKWNTNGTIPFTKSKKKLVNLNTNSLDLGSVYGDNPHQLAAVRNGSFIKMGDDGLMHRDEYGNFVCGDIRCNENTILIGFHTLFVLEHNRLAKNIQKRNPHLNDNQVFQKAKKRNTWQYQRIIYEEWLPILLGLKQFPHQKQSLYSDDFFSTVTFRFGHSIIPEEIHPGENLFDHYFKPNRLTNMTIMKKYMKGIMKIEQEEADLQMVDSLRNHLFPSSSQRLDLMALNIKRGRDHNLGSFLKYSSVYCKNPKSMMCFYKITKDMKLAKQLKKLYKSADRIDNFVGILSEPKYKKSLLGKTATLSILRHFQALAWNDPNFYSKDKGKTLKQLFKIHYGIKYKNIFKTS
jgi:peroxidase